MILHVIAGWALILIVLLQTGKGAAMGAAFGGSSQTVFGSAGAGGFLGKLTTGVAILFMITSLSLATMSNKTSSSIITEVTEDAKTQPQSEAPVKSEKQPPAEEKNQNETQE